MAASQAESDRIDPNDYVNLLTKTQTGAFTYSNTLSHAGTCVRSDQFVFWFTITSHKRPSQHHCRPHT